MTINESMEPECTQRAAREGASTKTLQKVLAVMCGILVLPFVLMGMRKTED